MGNRLAPLLAIAYMNKIESRSVNRDIILYKRYIDDILIIGENKAAVDEVFKNLHTDDIRLTREEPDAEGWLAYLNMKIRLKEEGFESEWYRKNIKKDLILREDSAHSVVTKIQTVRNMIKQQNNFLQKIIKKKRTRKFST